MYECMTCRKMLMIEFRAERLDEHSLNYAVKAVYPSIQSVAADIPERSRRYLKQAIDSLRAPDGSVMLAGSAVDAMLKARGLTKGSVYERIEAAVKSGLLTVEIGEWAHAVRLEANKPRHADDDDPHMELEDAERVIEFARMLGHILFTLPKEVNEGKKKAEARIPPEG